MKVSTVIMASAVVIEALVGVSALIRALSFIVSFYSERLAVVNKQIACYARNRNGKSEGLSIPLRPLGCG
jgi:hypothetical protein